MEERDPFGREKDDDPLEEMGWSAGEAAAQTGPAEIATPEQPDVAARQQVTREDLPGTTPPGTAPPPADHRADYIPPGGLRQRRNFAALGCLFPAVILVFIIGVGIIVATSLISGIDDELNDVFPTVPEPSDDPGGNDGPDTPPQGFSRGSLLLRGNLSPALRRLQRVTGSDQIRFLRVAADRVEVQVAVGGGRNRLAQATWRGDARVIATTPGGGAPPFPWSSVNASAPRRIVRETTPRRPARFDYTVLINAAGLRWSAFLKNGAGQFTASPDGRDVSRIGG